MTDEDFDPQQEQEYKSKTQLKQEMLELQALGKKLTQLSQPKLAKIPLDGELLEAINLAKRLEAKREREGLRRHMQFVGKLMRQRDVAPIEQALQLLENEHLIANQHFHALEQWRDRLIAEGDTAAHELCQQHPELEMQQLRQLIRQAKKESEQKKSPKAARSLFQLLKQHL